MTLNALLYYNTVTGAAATGGLDELGRHQFLQRFALAPGWTHMVATKDSLLYYNSTTTEIAIARMDGAGNHRILQRDLGRGVWTVIATTEDHVLFYDGATGRADIGAIDALGNYQTLQTHTDFDLGWTHIAAIQNSVLYYNAATTELATAHIDPAGNHSFINRYPAGSTPVWTDLISTQNHFLFYNVTEGGGSISRIDAAGNYIPLQDYPNLSSTWNPIAGTQKHVLYYNASAAVAATGDILDGGILRDLNFYDQFPPGITHIVAPKIAALPNPLDPLVDPIVELIRPDDLLNLRIECRNLQLDRSDSRSDLSENRTTPVLTATDAAQIAYLIVHFPPQTIAEEAVYEPRKEPGDNLEDEPKRQNTEKKPEEENRRIQGGLSQPVEELLKDKKTARARIAQPSRLVFQLPANSNPRIPYTTAGLLNWTGLEISVSAIAAIPEPSTPEQRANAPAIAPPSATETAIEMPFRLILSPNRTVVWHHAIAPKTQAGRTELWHTRLAYREGERIVDVSKAKPAPLRALWSPDYVAENSESGQWPTLGKADQWANQDVLTAMNGYDRHELVILTSAFRGFVENRRPIYPDYVPTPIQAEQVILSSLGGWLKSRGNWTPPVEWLPNVLGPIFPMPRPIDPNINPVANPVDPRLEDLMVLLDPAMGDRIVAQFPGVAGIPLVRRFGKTGRPLNISEWVHVATQGRDHYVRIVYEGYLYPFGHRAALIKVTERKFKTINGTPFAYLAQRMFIVVRKPFKDYTQEPLENNGLGMPLKQVRLTTLVTPDIELPQKQLISRTDYCFWIRVSGKDFKFHAVGQDSTGRTIDFTTALIFVPNSETSKIAQVKTDYDLEENLVRKVCNVPGQPVTYADRDPRLDSDNTTLTTRSLYFETHNAPIGGETGGFLPKLKQAAVNLAAVEQLLGTQVPTDIEYYPAYVAAGFDGANGVFAQLIKPVQSNVPADKAGGIATPNMAISSLTRNLGAIAGTPAKAASPDPFNPTDFFGAADASNIPKLFGKLPLTDLIAPGGTFASNAPKIQPLPNANPPAVELTWEPKVREFGPDFLRFTPDRAPATTRLIIYGRIEKPTGGAAGKSEFSGTLNDFTLTFLNVLILNFIAFVFKSETGKKTDVQVKLDPDNPLQFTGDLAFVEDLKTIIPPELFGKGPSLTVTADSIRVGFAIGLPTIAVGVFALKDVSLSAALELPFADGNPVFDFGISEKQHPFNLTIAFFGGGGFFHLQLDTQQGLRVVEAAFEFGASVSINLGVASGGVHIMAGIYFKLEIKKGEDYATLTGFFRMGGELSILGLISLSLEFLLSFTYEGKTKKAFGIASLTVKIEILCFSKSIEITVEKQFGGKSADPMFKDTWTEPAIWAEYAGAFA